MNTYLLRNARKVQPQKSTTTSSSNTGTAGQVLGQPVAHIVGPALFVGLDVDTDSISVSLAPADAAEVRRYGLIGGSHDDVLRLAKKLQAAHPQHALRTGRP